MEAVQAVDMIEELKLRRWARENYVAPAGRDPSWHPIVHDEMRTRDRELASSLPDSADAAVHAAGCSLHNSA